jgi:uncharacterized membrane protein
VFVLFVIPSESVGFAAAAVPILVAAAFIRLVAAFASFVAAFVSVLTLSLSRTGVVVSPVQQKQEAPQGAAKESTCIVCMSVYDVCDVCVCVCMRA